MEILVLREGVHGLSAESYADALRERLDGHTVRHAATPAAEREAVRTADIVTGLHISRSLLERASELEIFACAYAGTGHLPLDALDELGVTVTNAAGVHTPNASEQVIGSILAFTRGIHRAAQTDHWESFTPGELAGSTVTIVGLGGIGKGVAERLEPFGVTTIGVRRTPATGGPTDEVIGPDRLHEALARSEYLVLCCPLTDATRGLIGREEIATLPPEALIVNVARGEVVETDALVYGLRRGSIRGAVLDVTDPEPLPDDHPLWGLDNVIVTPHNAGGTPKYYERLADIVADNVTRHQRGKPLRNRVRIDQG